MTSLAARPTYWSIQYLRGIAAVGVVVFHVYENPPVPLGTNFWIGAHGVDIFFVISGFIMYAAARTERFVQFVSRRLIRIFPLYWLATLIAMALYWYFDRVRASGTETALSLLLAPHYSEAHPTQIWPILVPGWTLSYELLFYVLFAAGIAARRVVLVPGLAIAALVLIGALFRPHVAPLAVATDPRLLEFLSGLMIAFALHRRPSLVPAIAAGSWAATIVGFVASWDRTMIFAGATAIVSGAILLETRYMTKPNGALRLLGDASYSIYLFHIPFLLVIERLFATTETGLPPVVAHCVVLVCAGVAVMAGIAAHRMVERPLLRTLNTWNRRLLKPIHDPVAA